jgi:hypothetical protein
MWKQGESGNPGGRPKQGKQLTALAREYTTSAMETLIEIMEDKSAPKSARAKAAEVILDRGWGKAPQTVNLNTNPLDNLDVDQQRLMLSALELLAGNQSGDDRRPEAATH